MKEFKIEKTERGLPKITGDGENITRIIASEIESRLVESKTLEKNNEENFIQKIKRLEDKIIELRKMPMTVELEKEIRDKEYEINTLVEKN